MLAHTRRSAAAMPFALEWLAASIGCTIADGTFNALEVLKVKLQLQPAGEAAIYPGGVLASLRQIVAEDGLVRGLLEPGLLATTLRSFTYVGFRIGAYPSVRAALAPEGGGADPPLSVKIAAGCVTGGVGSALFCPIDVVRVRLQADAGTVGPGGALVSGLRRGRPPRYATTLGAFGAIARDEGVGPGLYRGAHVTIARASVLSGAQLASYDSLKRAGARALGLEEGPALHLACSLASGLIAQTAIQPIDTVRSCLMGAQGAAGREMVVAGLREHGPAFLYRGFFPACLRQGPVMLVQMPIVEQLRLAFGLRAF